MLASMYLAIITIVLRSMLECSLMDKRQIQYQYLAIVHHITDLQTQIRLVVSMGLFICIILVQQANKSMLLVVVHYMHQVHILKTVNIQAQCNSQHMRLQALGLCLMLEIFNQEQQGFMEYQTHNKEIIQNDNIHT